jgi:hypothetical protein
MGNLTPEMRAAFEEFIVEIPMLLDQLGELLESSNNYRATRVAFDDESLDRIEQFYLDVLAGRERVDVSQARLNRMIIAFFGEAVRERVGGSWELNDVDGDPAFGTPVIVEWAEAWMRISPVELREQQIEGRKPFLRDLIEYAANVDEEDLDQI